MCWLCSPSLCRERSLLYGTYTLFSPPNLGAQLVSSSDSFAVLKPLLIGSFRVSRLVLPRIYICGTERHGVTTGCIYFVGCRASSSLVGLRVILPAASFASPTSDISGTLASINDTISTTRFATSPSSGGYAGGRVSEWGVTTSIAEAQTIGGSQVGVAQVGVSSRSRAISDANSSSTSGNHGPPPPPQTVSTTTTNTTPK